MRSETMFDHFVMQLPVEPNFPYAYICITNKIPKISSFKFGFNVKLYVLNVT